jgi:predicted transcriptional regulator
MKRRLIPTAEVKQLATEGYGVSEIADKLGFTKSAISKALKRMNVAVVKETARQAPVIVEKGINAIDQLQTINDHANWLLDHLMRWTKAGCQQEGACGR